MRQTFPHVNHFFARLSTSFLYFLKKIFMKNLLERYIKGTSTWFFYKTLSIKIINYLKINKDQFSESVKISDFGNKRLSGGEISKFSI